jgi:hypothetical protein
MENAQMANLKWFCLFLLATVIVTACASSDEKEYYGPGERHPSADLSDQFFPDQGMPTGSKGTYEFFSKKCSPRSSSDHYSKTEYFCEH